MQVIPIFFSTNDNYLPIVSVMMQSIMENALQDRSFKFIILHSDVSQNSMKKISNMVAKFHNFTINFVNFSQVIKDCNFFVSRHITVETYFRLWIPFKFPQYEKAIYLDGDMVCNADISQLFDIDISDYLIGGVRDIAVAWYFSPKKYQTMKYRKIYEYMLSMENPENYINAGMLLINCKKFREKYLEKDVIDTIFLREWQVHDQDVINFLTQNNVLHISYEWDYMPCGWAQYLPENFKQDYQSAENYPKIIHFKPYSDWYYIPHFEKFWKYATRTPFIDEIVNKVNKNGILEKGLDEKIAETIKNRIGLGGKTMLKLFWTYIISKFSKG